MKSLWKQKREFVLADVPRRAPRVEGEWLRANRAPTSDEGCRERRGGLGGNAADSEVTARQYHAAPLAAAATRGGGDLDLGQGRDANPVHTTWRRRSERASRIWLDRGQPSSCCGSAPVECLLPLFGYRQFVYCFVHISRVDSLFYQ